MFFERSSRSEWKRSCIASAASSTSLVYSESSFVKSPDADLLSRAEGGKQEVQFEGGRNRAAKLQTRSGTFDSPSHPSKSRSSSRRQTSVARLTDLSSSARRMIFSITMIRTCRFGTAEREGVASAARRRVLVEAAEEVSTGLEKSAASRLVVRSGAEGLIDRVAGRGIDNSSGAEMMPYEGNVADETEGVGPRIALRMIDQSPSGSMGIFTDVCSVVSPRSGLNIEAGVLSNPVGEYDNGFPQLSTTSFSLSSRRQSTALITRERHVRVDNAAKSRKSSESSNGLFRQRGSGGNRSRAIGE